MPTEQGSPLQDLPEDYTNNQIRHKAEEGLLDEDKVINNHELANDDGSIVETLDTAFHGEPGMIDGHSIAGSNRADYYEARSQGKSDSEEELEVLRKQKSD